MNPLVAMLADDAREIMLKVQCGELRDKRIVLTGASGLIGVNFLACLQLLSKRFNDDFSVTALMQTAPCSYVKSLCDYSGCKIMRGDLTDSSFCKTLPGADYIIHAAGYAQPGRFMQNPVKTLQLNTSTVYALFNKLSAHGKFLFISSSEVYSGLAAPPFFETQTGTTGPSHARACYIEGKRCGEAIVNAYRTRGIQAKSARLSLVYGPGTRPGDTRALNAFIQKALSGSITMLDQGNARRMYCYAADSVEILWKILLFGQRSVYNVGGNSATTIGQLADKIGKYLHVPVIYPERPAPLSGAPDDVVLDMSAVRDEFGKTDYVPLDTGLHKTIEWQKILYQTENEGDRN